MNLIEAITEQEYIVEEARSQAVHAHWDWVALCEMYSAEHPLVLDALAKKRALTDILDEAWVELEALQEEVKHG